MIAVTKRYGTMGRGRAPVFGVVGAVVGASERAERKIQRGEVGKGRFEDGVHFLSFFVFVGGWQLWELMED